MTGTRPGYLQSPDPPRTHPEQRNGLCKGTHRGQPGCHYLAEPDLLLELEEEPQDLELIRVADYDGDGRSDFSIMRLLPATSADVSSPVQVDFYLSGTP